MIIDIGSNGNNLVLEGRGARQGNCVDALGQSVIGQVSACNTVNFYRAANAEIANGIAEGPGDRYLRGRPAVRDACVTSP